jgi:hypothetical protein
LLGTSLSIHRCTKPNNHGRDNIQHDAFRKGSDALERNRR